MYCKLNNKIKIHQRSEKLFLKSAIKLTEFCKRTKVTIDISVIE